jgi:hypothetical protein
VKALSPEELHACYRWHPLDELVELSGNPNLGDESALRDSLATFGWVDGIVTHSGVVIAGNHRLRRAVADGEAGLPGYDLTAYPVSDVGELLAIALADNATSRAGSDDPALLAEAQASIAAVDMELAELAGYVDIASLIDLPPLPDDLAAPAAPNPEADTRILIVSYPADRFALVVARLERLARRGETHSDVVARKVLRGS